MNENNIYSRREWYQIGYKDAQKETAREIIEMLVPPCEVCDENWHKGCLCLRAKIAKKITEKYGINNGNI